MPLTPLQQLIEWSNNALQTERNVLSAPKSTFSKNDVNRAKIILTAVETVIKKATELLPLERRVIEDAFVIPGSNIRDSKAAEKYFEETFKQ